MRFDRIVLHNYKPFLHGGPSTISIDLHANVIPIIGNNGSGKSSLLRAMTVFPAQSSDFEIDGYKELYLTHNNSEYILRSEFQRNKGVHSFIKDGIELNLAQNSTAQTSLCETHFGMSNLIRDLTSGSLNITQLSKVARKDILLSCYPSDLSFVLEHHKAVSSKLRAVRSNIKMMNVRLQEISNKLIAEEEYNSLSALDKEFVDFQAGLDNWIYRLQQEIEMLKTHDQYYPSLRTFDQSEFQSRNTQIKDLLRSIPNSVVYETPDVNSKISVIKSVIDMRKSSLAELSKLVASLIQEIEEYETIEKDDVEQEIQHAKTTIADIEQAIASATIDQALPLADVPSNVDDVLVNMNDHIMLLHGCCGSILPTRAIRELENKLAEINYKGSSLGSEIRRLETQASQLSDKIAREKSISFNSKCTMSCQLKDSFNGRIDALVQERADVVKLLDKFKLEHSVAYKEKEDIITRISPSRQVIKSIEFMEMFYKSNNWCVYIADSVDSFIDKLSHNASIVYNTIARIYSNSRLIKSVNRLNEDLNAAKYRLKILIEHQLPTKQTVSRVIVGKRVELKKLQDSYISIEKERNSLSEQLINYQTLYRARTSFDEFAALSMSQVNTMLIQAKIDALIKVVSDLRSYKSLAISKQSELTGTLKAQSHLRIRLKEEVEPTLIKLQEDQDRLVIIEAALSPSSGIPHVYMTRFINSVLRTANEYIASVWNYHLCFKELSESDVLDFDFPIVLYDKSGVKDASMCSKGEQEMLNLAFTLALCVHMDIGNKFPIRLDEVDSGFAYAHRDKLLELLSTLTRQGLIKQLILVNHFPALFSAFANSQIICLNPEGIAVPTVYNEGVSMVA